MKKIIFIALVFAMLPGAVRADIIPQKKLITGVVTTVDTYRVTFKSNNAATYVAEVARSILVRKYGASMELSEIIAGDKIEVSGQLWPDNSMNAEKLRDLSLYAHKGTFTGVISKIDQSGSLFILESKENGIQTIHTNYLTAFRTGEKTSAFNNLETGMTASVKGGWERTIKDISASDVEARFKFINIELTGVILAKAGTGLTINANGNVLYGVAITKARLQNKKGRSIDLKDFNVGDQVKIKGEHLKGNAQVVANTVTRNSE